jgi:CRISPR/Cas system-associated exonuclease Cas4 (RecB family)
MSKIDTLVQDIYGALDRGVELDAVKLGEMIARRLKETKVNDALRMSNFGTPCERKLWYTVNQPDRASPLPAHARLNFLLGDIIEETVLQIVAQDTDHEVKGEQDELEIAGIKGHRDAIIDGVLVDVKSANARSVEKFRYHKVREDDPFGYYDQLSLYVAASQEDVSVKDEGAFLVVDKEKGHVYLDKYKIEPRDWEKEITSKREMLSRPEPPARGFASEPHNKSGNMKLCTACSYCPFKKTCWPTLRMFAYSNGIVNLVRVVKEPEVPEIKV